MLGPDGQAPLPVLSPRELYLIVDGVSYWIEIVPNELVSCGKTTTTHFTYTTSVSRLHHAFLLMLIMGRSHP